jgi:hypothetical protein
MPGVDNWTRNNYSYGFSQSFQASMARNVALNGGSLGSQQGRFNQFRVNAGLGSAENLGAASTMFDFQSQQQNARSGAFAQEAGGAVAAAVGANAPGFNKVEGVQQGIGLTNRSDELLKGGASSGMDMIMQGKFRQLGIENIVMIKTFTDMGLTNKATWAVISRYVNNKNPNAKMTPERVGQVLGQGAAQFVEMNEFVLGKQNAADLKKAGGGDLVTRMQAGTKAGDATSVGGATIAQAFEADFSQAAKPGTAAPSKENMADTQAAGTAKLATTAEQGFEGLLEKTGEKVTDAMVKAINGGFEQAARAVRDVGDKLRTEQAKPAPAVEAPKPFGGTKETSPTGKGY